MLSPTRSPALGQLDFCALIPKNIPLLSDVVKRVGCNPASRAALSAAIAQQLSPQPATPGGVAQPPAWYVPIAAVGGPQLIADCLCKGQPQTGPYPGGYPGYYAPPQPWYQSPLVIGGIVVGLGVLAFALSNRPAHKESDS